jgi:hypothetical protein
MANKLVRGSLIILIGNIIFRLGGYVYRFLMAIRSKASRNIKALLLRSIRKTKTASKTKAAFPRYPCKAIL